VDLLRHTLGDLSQEWIDGVDELVASTAGDSDRPTTHENAEYQTTSGRRTIWDLGAQWAGDGAGVCKKAFSSVWMARLLGSLDWNALISRLPRPVANQEFDNFDLND
jgi:hypothetical protein